MERAKAGDKSIFTGTFIVIPDVSQLGLPGVNSEMQREAARGAASGAGNTGVTGLKSLGVRDLQYKTAFLACMVQDADARVRLSSSLKWILSPPSFLHRTLVPTFEEKRPTIIAKKTKRRSSRHSRYPRSRS